MSDLAQIQFAIASALDALARFEDTSDNALIISSIERYLSWLFDQQAIAEERLALGTALS